MGLSGSDNRGRKCFLQCIYQNLAILEVKTLKPRIQEILFYRLEFEKYVKYMNIKNGSLDQPTEILFISY